MISLNKLMVIAAGGFVACLGMVEVFRRQVSKEIHSNVLFEEALAMLRENKGARYLLGQPIATDSLASYSGPGLKYADHVDFKVRVTGPKSKGILFITAKPDKEEKLQLNTVQLQVGGDGTKRLVIKKAEENTA